MGVSPASKAIRKLNDWQVGLIYEMAMNFPVESLRKCYLEYKNSTSNFDDDDVLDMGYSPEQLAEIKGKR
ncbi:MAG: hypothetical protein LBQ89_08240 [Treponema sp.]|nr:hypothetical protein [Treponema sp.]